MTELFELILMRVWADGGQGRSRRNAWRAMAADAQRARARAEVEQSLLLAEVKQPA
ncbi:MAG TPA: hypothetical protein VG708_02780 [Mycobacteriales bacterium]|jgi:hypothetical protein|nr:hypothetical protein [Mycobacteriales bacterium]